MEGKIFRLSRRGVLKSLGIIPLLSSPAQAFGTEGAFHVRPLAVDPPMAGDPRATAVSRWAWELVRRTSAPARLVPQTVAADAPTLLSEPFTIWWGAKSVRALSDAEVRGLRQYLKLGGILFVDDSDPKSGEFGRSVRREMERVLPQSAVVRLPQRHVVYKSYYLLERPVGRVSGPDYLEAIVDGKSLQVVFSSHDLLGALAREPGDDNWSLTVAEGPRQRELATRLAVNVAMYVLCLDYKDDQVHAKELMRRRDRRRR